VNVTFTTASNLLVPALILLALALGVALYVTRYPALHPRRRAVLLAVRTLTLSALLFAALGPVVRYSTASRERNRMLVLVDHSGSMEVRDGDASGRTRREVADSALRRAVHRRGVHDAPAQLDEAPQHVALGAAPGRIGDVECLPCAQAEGGDRLAARRNRAERLAHGLLSRISSYEGNEYIGITFMVCSPTRGPMPIRPRRSMMGAYITRSMVSC